MSARNLLRAGLATLGACLVVGLVGVGPARAQDRPGAGSPRGEKAPAEKPGTGSEKAPADKPEAEPGEKPARKGDKAAGEKPPAESAPADKAPADKAPADKAPADKAGGKDKAKGGTDIPAGVEYPIKIQTAVWVENVLKIDEVEGTFIAEVKLVLRWNDERLKFDAKATGLDRLELGFEDALARLATIWTPQISIANMDRPIAEQRNLVIHARGAVDLVWNVTAKFKTALDFSRFPFDKQMLRIELRSPRYGVSQVILAQDGTDRHESGAKAGLSIPNWHFGRSVDFRVTTSRGWTKRDHSVAYADLTAHRETGQYFFKLFLPYFTIMLFPPLALWVPKADVMPRANLTFSGLFALIAYSYSVFAQFPMLAAVDNMVVTMLVRGYVYMAFVLLLIMTVHNPAFTSNFGGKHVWAEAASWTTWSVPAIFVVAIASRVFFSM